MNSLPLQNQRVLLVEDLPDPERCHLQILQRAGATVTLECHGPGAITAFLKTPEPFAAVLLDLQLSVSDALETASTLRRLDFDCPVVALCNLIDDSLEQLLLQAGCTTLVTKPAAAATLIAAICSESAACST